MARPKGTETGVKKKNKLVNMFYHDIAYLEKKSRDNATNFSAMVGVAIDFFRKYGHLEKAFIKIEESRKRNKPEPTPVEPQSEIETDIDKI